MTLAGSFREQAREHNLRGLLHSMLGRHSYACGAYVKGMKDYARSIEVGRIVQSLTIQNDRPI
jgi:hypothetical protein